MRVLIFTQYFTPELTAASARLHPIASGLAAQGHEVEVVSELPSHPRGIVDPEYRGGFSQRRSLDGFQATYVWVHATPKKTAAHRVANYASYAGAAALSTFRGARPDVIIASSPPLPTGAAAAVIAWRFRAPWVLDVRDLWPEFAVTLGELTNPRLVRAAEWLERRLYASAARIVTPTEPFRDHIVNLVEDPEKVALLPNGTTSDWIRVGTSEPERDELGLAEDRFVWAYAGNLGIAQDVGTAVQAAALLGDEYQLLLVGDGPLRNDLEATAAGLSDGVVRFTGLVERAQAARFMRAADALLVPLVADPSVGRAIPSKLYDCCAVRRPVIVAAPGETRRIAERYDAALGVEPGNAEALADAVRGLRNDRALADRLVDNAAAFATEHVRERQVERLEGLLSSVV